MDLREKKLDFSDTGADAGTGHLAGCSNSLNSVAPARRDQFALYDSRLFNLRRLTSGGYRFSGNALGKIDGELGGVDVHPGAGPKPSGRHPDFLFENAAE